MGASEPVHAGLSPWLYHPNSTYAVEGLMCGTCIAELMEAVRFLPHVTGVEVSLVTGGASPLVLRSDEALAPATVLECVARAGFHGSEIRTHGLANFSEPSQEARRVSILARQPG